jgi:tetratricopeptide (TPR) repeat protein
MRITPELGKGRRATRLHLSAQELAFEMAAQDFAQGDYEGAVEQLQAVPPAMTTAPVAFLLAEAEGRYENGAPSWDTQATCRKLLALAPGALAADVALARVMLAERNYAQAAGYARRVLTVHRSNDAALEVLARLAVADHQADASTAEINAVWSERLAEHPSCEALQEAVSFHGYRHEAEQAFTAQKSLEGCAPESLAYAQSLAEQGSHAEAAEGLQKLLAAAPLNRGARLMLIRELQLAGQDTEAQRAAAEWLHIAPNAASYRRLATLESNSIVNPDAVSGERQPFYETYRRDVLQLLHEGVGSQSDADAALLLDDHVAVARADGSVSLYVHRATRILSPAGASRYASSALPEDSQVLQLRRVTAEGNIEAATVDTFRRQIAYGSLAPGDTIDEEYVVNYTGDGGISERSEVFQFVFGSFDMPIESARFVVLTTAEQPDQGVVIATGDAPKMTARLDNGMLARLWEKSAGPQSAGVASSTHSGLAIVRVVEQENGWMVPRDAERRRRIETIHPGPRLEES